MRVTVIGAGDVGLTTGLTLAHTGNGRIRFTADAAEATIIVNQPLPEDDPRRRRADIAVAREVLGWEPRVPLWEGLTSTIAHYRERLIALVSP